MALRQFNIKVIVNCKDENEARQVQNAVNGMSQQIDLIGSELLTFHSKFGKHQSVLIPAIKECMSNPWSIPKHIATFYKLK